METQGKNERMLARKPEFDGGAFTISHFSPSPEGFEFKTRGSIGRTESEASNNALSDDDRLRLKKAMSGEMKFNNVQPLRDARASWHNALKEGRSDGEIKSLEEKFYEERKTYQAKGKKVGLRNINVDGNTLQADIQFVSFPVYNEFARPNDSPQLLDLSAATGTAMILKSADGRLVIQHRAVSKQRLQEEGLSRGNATYNDIPGASVAGMLDASLRGKDRRAGTPDVVDTTTIKGNILKEASEELGLDPEDMDQLRVVGLAQDKVKIHDEVLLLADTKLTSDQISAKSRLSKRNQKLGDADFEEKFIDIPATPQAVETLLTDVKCPLPPTHYAAMVAAGYSLVLQESGLPAAEQWKSDMEGKMQGNIRQMNKMVKDFYDQHPEALTQVPERFWGKNVPQRKLQGYDPAYTPEEQGLPSFEDEMVRTGLIEDDRRHVDMAYLFDVDGVLSDPTEKKVTEQELYEQVVKRLKDGRPVCLNTGRSTDWAEKRILDPLLDRIEDKTILGNLVVVGEKGGTWTTFDKEGNVQRGKVKSLEVPDELNERVKALVEEKYSHAMSIYESGETEKTKQTMISVEMTDGFDHIEFTRLQKRFAEELNDVLGERDEWGKYKVDSTSIATDVESKYVGKALGTDRFLQFLRDKGIKPEKFVAVGDSISDLEMADELQRRNQKVEFVYVGSEDKFEEAKANGKIKDGEVVKNVGRFTQGTLQYLQEE